MSRAPAKKKRTPRQAWRDAERAEKRAIAQVVREREAVTYGSVDVARDEIERACVEFLATAPRFTFPKGRRT